MNKIEIITALVTDPNIPISTVDRAICVIVEEWQRSAGDLFSERGWRRFNDTIFSNNLFLLGPCAVLNTKRVRVARLMSIHRFMDYYLGGESTSPAQVKRVESTLIGCKQDGLDITNAKNHFWGSDGSVQSTLHSELKDMTPDDIRDNLGILDIIKEPLVCITYEIDTEYLRTPTVIDFGLHPAFVSKPLFQTELPRAWNWQKGGWGLPVFVHSPYAPIQLQRAYLLGSFSSNVAKVDLFRSFCPQPSQELEHAFEQSLRKVCAHQELERFFRGKSALLSIDHYQFERFVGTLYERRGYRTKVTQAARDGGFDVIAFSDSEHQNGLLIQVKHVEGTVGIRIIRELIGARFLAPEEYSNYMLAIVTTGRFSKPAKDAEEQFSTQLKLVDYKALQSELSGYRNIGMTDILQEALDVRRKTQKL